MEGLKTSSSSSSSSSSSIRFLDLDKQPDSYSNPIELIESDVVWSPDHSESTDLNSPDLSTKSNSPNNNSRQDQHPFRPAKYGLSAALTDDHPPLIRRKPSLSPSLSAASAARSIRSVPPHRLSSSYDESSGSGRFMQSAPVNIPVWPKWRQGEGELGPHPLDHVDEDEDGEDELEEKMVFPPHVMLARSQSMTFSVFEGVGRTLKGRDLRRVRNAVFQKTGFID